MSLRIGYACINTLLPSPNRTLRLANASAERVIELGRQNLNALAQILKWNQQHGVRLFRLSSDLIPLGSHPANAAVWWDALAPELERVGAMLRAYGMRVSMHPGQYTVLNSPRPEVVEASMRELEYHARLMDALGTDFHHPIVLHLGGVYGDKVESMRRFVANFRALRARSPFGQSAAERLILENDEKNYNLADALALSGSIGAPVVWDIFHHAWNPALEEIPPAEILARVGTTWSAARGPQKIHYSNQWPGKPPGSHSQTVDMAAFGIFYHQVLAPYSDGKALDVMLEVKDKEQSVLAVYARFPQLAG
jgi:UV DNA damage endonuclease